MNEMVTRQISAMLEMDYPELREMWDGFFENPPHSKNKTYMIRRLSRRVQELAYGGLSSQGEKRLRELKNRHKSFAKRYKFLPPEGTQLIREYNGIEHRVTVLADGFEYNNIVYASLSRVAFAITGTKWSGPKFFGLKT